MMILRFLIVSMWFWCVSPAWANVVHVAVAANFAVPMKKISAEFEKKSGHSVVMSIGSTGKFYAQIKNGAPFDVFLSADQRTPTLLMQERAGVSASQFTYAIGKLVLWSAKSGEKPESLLKKGYFAHLAIATPLQSPYGVAAQETLKVLDLSDTRKSEIQSKIVQGENIGQAYAFVSTGNAEIGFVALSQVWENNRLKSGSMWMVPPNLYSPLRQDAILLNHGKDNAAAIALLAYLKSDDAKKTISSFGYIPNGTQEPGFWNAVRSDLLRYKSSPCHWACLRFVPCSSPLTASHKSGFLNSIGYSAAMSTT